jgi:plastocyanin
MRWCYVAGLAAIVAGVLACGGSSNPTAPTGSCTPSSNPNTIVIQNNQVCPQRITVTRGSQVTMINNDTRNHTMDSDPHPEHTQCPELNQIDFLNSGQQRSSGNLNTVRTCGFHDHSAPDNAALRGTITIQ